MKISSNELNRLDKINSILANLGINKITVDDLVYASELSFNKTFIKALENLFLYRAQVQINNNDLNQISIELYAASVALIDDYKDSAIKLRRYSNQFRIIRQLLQSNLLYTVSYFKENECNKCEFLSEIDLNIESEVINPSCPVLDCTIPLKICRNIPRFKPVRDSSGKLVRHNKDYKGLLKIKIDYNED